MEASKVRGALEAGWPELASMLVEHDADPDRSGLAYMEMAAIARFLATKIWSGDIGHFETFFDAVERCLHEGVGEAVTLVVVGLLEDLQNSGFADLDPGELLPYLRPTSRRAWQAVEEFWNGDARAIARFSAQQST